MGLPLLLTALLLGLHKVESQKMTTSTFMQLVHLDDPEALCNDGSPGEQRNGERRTTT